MNRRGFLATLAGLVGVKYAPKLPISPPFTLDVPRGFYKSQFPQAWASIQPTNYAQWATITGLTKPEE